MYISKQHLSCFASCIKTQLTSKTQFICKSLVTGGGAQQALQQRKLLKQFTVHIYTRYTTPIRLTFLDRALPQEVGPVKTVTPVLYDNNTAITIYKGTQVFYDLYYDEVKLATHIIATQGDENYGEIEFDADDIKTSEYAIYIGI